MPAALIWSGADGHQDDFTLPSPWGRRGAGEAGEVLENLQGSLHSLCRELLELLSCFGASELLCSWRC